jgi:hypothetical protein
MLLIVRFASTLCSFLLLRTEGSSFWVSCFRTSSNYFISPVWQVNFYTHIMYLFLYDDVLLGTPSTPSWTTTGLLHFGCTGLFIQYTRSYLAYLQSVSTIGNPRGPQGLQTDRPSGRGSLHVVCALSSCAVSVVLFLLWFQPKYESFDKFLPQLAISNNVKIRVSAVCRAPKRFDEDAPPK